MLAIPAMQQSESSSATAARSPTDMASISDEGAYFYLDPHLRSYEEIFSDENPTWKNHWICSLGLRGDNHIPALPRVYEKEWEEHRAIYVRGFDFGYSDAKITEILYPYGRVTKLPIIVDTTSQETFRWVIMQNQGQAMFAVQTMHYMQFEGRRLNVALALKPGRSMTLRANISSMQQERSQQIERDFVQEIETQRSNGLTYHDHPTQHTSSTLGQRALGSPAMPPARKYEHSGRSTPLVPPGFNLSSTSLGSLASSSSSLAAPQPQRRSPFPFINSVTRSESLTGDLSQGELTTGDQDKPLTLDILHAVAASAARRSLGSLQESSTPEFPLSQIQDSHSNENTRVLSRSPAPSIPPGFTDHHHYQFDPAGTFSLDTAWGQYLQQPPYMVNGSSQAGKSPSYTNDHLLKESLHETVPTPTSQLVHKKQQTVTKVEELSSVGDNVPVVPEKKSVQPHQPAKTLPAIQESVEESPFKKPAAEEPKPVASTSKPATSSWARIAAADLPEKRLIDLHPQHQRPRAPSVSRAIEVPTDPHHESDVDQMRVVFLLNLPRHLTVSDISNAIKEGPVRNINFAHDSNDGSRFVVIIFQHARDSECFVNALLKERAEKKPDRFRFLVDVVRGHEKFPMEEVLIAMGPPTCASRRLTLVKASFFFAVGERQLRIFCEKFIDASAIQLIWIYNGGNATIVFADVLSAMMMKEEFDKASVGGSSHDTTQLFHGIQATYSKDPCAIHMELKTAMLD